MMARNTLIIGKRANLSQALAQRFNASRLIAGDELHSLPSLLADTGSNNLIYNLYHKSALLDQTNVPKQYADYAFAKLAEFVSLCLEHHQRINSVIFTSSSSVYGDNAEAVETDKPDITNLYASLKLASEFFLRDHLKVTPIRLIIPRVFNMYGGSDEFSVVSKIASALSGKREITIVNQGTSIRDFIHINDVVLIYQKLLESSCVGVVNVGTGKGVSVRQLIAMAEAAFECKLLIRHTHRPEITQSVACTEQLMRHIGNYSFETIANYYSQCAEQAE